MLFIAHDAYAQSIGLSDEFLDVALTLAGGVCPGADGASAEVDDVVDTFAGF